jgi:hypothetical protein
MHFCALPDPSPRLAVLGVLSVDSHTTYRREIRESWLAAPSSEIVVKFVLRGLGAAVDTVAEAGAHDDMLFVRAEAGMPRKSGPLMSLSLWLQCALVAWPAASLIGKADDDTWVHLPGTAAHLRGSLATLQAQDPAHAPPLMYWGLMESYSWELHSHRPRGFQQKYARAHTGARCKRSSYRGKQKLRSGADNSSEWLDSEVSGRRHWGKGVGANASYEMVGPFHFAKARARPVPVGAARGWVRARALHAHARVSPGRRLRRARCTSSRRGWWRR